MAAVLDEIAIPQFHLSTDHYASQINFTSSLADATNLSATANNRTEVAVAVMPSDMLLTLMIYFWFVILIIPIGIVCNILAIVVCLGSKQIRRTTTGHYMTALAIADLIYLGGEVIRMLNMQAGTVYVTGLKFMDENNEVCRLTYVARYYGQFTCAWLTVAITGERCLTIALPLKVASLSTTTSTKAVIGGVFTVGFALTLFPIWTVGLLYDEDFKSNFCSYFDKGIGYDMWLTVVVRMGSVIVPCCLVFVLTGIILYFLYRAKARRRHHMEGQNVLASSTHSMERQLTASLLAVAMAFLVLRLPYIVTYYLKEYQMVNMRRNNELSKTLYIVNKVADVLSIVNYDVNFFLYCLCGSVFRRQLVLCWRCQKVRNAKRSSITLTTYHSTRSRSSMMSYQSLMKRRDTNGIDTPASAMRYSATCDLIDMANGRRSLSSCQLSRCSAISARSNLQLQLQQQMIINKSGGSPSTKQRSNLGIATQQKAISDTMISQCATKL